MLRLAALPGVGTLLAACAPAPASTPAPSTAQATTIARSSAVVASTAAAKKVTLVLATTNLDISYEPYGVLARQLGWFQKAGLDVTIQTAATGAAINQLLLTGQAQIGMSAPDNLMTAQAQLADSPILMFYQLINKSIYTFAVLPDSPITTIADLKGKKIGVPVVSPTWNPFLDRKFQDAGFTNKDVTQVGAGFGVQAIQALQGHSIDAFLGWPGLWAAFKNAGYDFRLFPYESWQNDLPGIGLIAMADYIKKNPDVITAVGVAEAMTAVYLQKSAVAGVKAFWKEYPERAPRPGADPAKAQADDVAVLTSTLEEMRTNELPSDYAWGSLDRKVWQNDQDQLLRSGLLNEPVPLDQVMYTDLQGEYAKFDHASVQAQAEKDAGAGSPG